MANAFSRMTTAGRMLNQAVVQSSLSTKACKSINEHTDHAAHVLLGQGQRVNSFADSADLVDCIICNGSSFDLTASDGESWPQHIIPAYSRNWPMRTRGRSLSCQLRSEKSLRS